MTAASRAVPRRTLRPRFGPTRARRRRRARATSGPGQLQQELRVLARALADVVHRDALVVAVHAAPFHVVEDEGAPAEGGEPHAPEHPAVGNHDEDLVRDHQTPWPKRKTADARMSNLGAG